MPETVISCFSGASVSAATHLSTDGRCAKAFCEAGFAAMSPPTSRAATRCFRPGWERTKRHARIASICKDDFGFAKDIMLVAHPDWKRMIDENPFPEAVDQPTTLHAFVLRSSPAGSCR